MKRKKIKRTLNSIGKNYFMFDFNAERKIYEYLCYKDANKKIKKEIKEENQFEYYWQWEQYVRNKYANYDDVKLREFSRYLNQRLRREEPTNEYMKLLISVLLTIGITYMTNLIINYKSDSTVPFWFNFIFYLIVVAMFLIGLGAIFKTTYLPMLESNDNRNMLQDYKEIIDDMIKFQNQEVVQLE